MSYYGYLYLIQKEAWKGTIKYKVGKTENYKQRLNSTEYRNCDVYELCRCPDYEVLERKLIDCLTEKFPYLDTDEHGDEDLMGDLFEIKHYFHKICKKHTISCNNRFFTQSTTNIEDIEDDIYTGCIAIYGRKYIVRTNNTYEFYKAQELMEKYKIDTKLIKNSLIEFKRCKPITNEDGTLSLYIHPVKINNFDEKYYNKYINSLFDSVKYKYLDNFKLFINSCHEMLVNFKTNKSKFVILNGDYIIEDFKKVMKNLINSDNGKIYQGIINISNDISNKNFITNNTITIKFKHNFKLDLIDIYYLYHYITNYS